MSKYEDKGCLLFTQTSRSFAQNLDGKTDWKIFEMNGTSWKVIQNF